MSREVRYDGTGTFEVRFPFDRELVDLIKSLPSRRWNASERYWSIPEDDVVALVDLLHPERFRFDTPTCEMYVLRGGAADLAPATGPAAPPPIRAGVLPGLFDEPPTAEAHAPAQLDHLSVSGLNEQVRRVIENAFPAAVWLVGEISGFNRNAHKRHVGFQLVEHDDSGRTLSSVDATLFDKSRRTVQAALERAGAPFQLEDEVLVRVLARVELYVPWGSYRVIVEEIDVHFTLGEAARRREEIIRKLTEAGLTERNTRLQFPALPLRVGLITSLSSDAYNDVLRSLQESGLAFHVTAHGARVQGRATEPSVLNALDRFGRMAGELDVIVICRGGGSRTDLAWFDSEALGRAVAEFPLPVVVGIGHEQDRSVLDAVGWSCRTPTAAARLLVDRVRESLERVEVTGRAVFDQAARRLEQAALARTDQAERLVRAARGLVERESVRLDHRRERALRGSAALLERAAEQVARWRRDVPRAASVLLVRQREAVSGIRRAIVQGARRDVTGARQKLDGRALRIAPAADRLVARESERTEGRRRRLHLVDPRRVLERGYAILRLASGKVLTRAAMAPDGTLLSADLKEGRLQLRSGGAEPETGGD